MYTSFFFLFLCIQPSFFPIPFFFYVFNHIFFTYSLLFFPKCGFLHNTSVPALSMHPHSAQWSRSIGEGIGWGLLGVESWFFAYSDIFASLEHPWVHIFFKSVIILTLISTINSVYGKLTSKNQKIHQNRIAKIELKMQKIASRKSQISKNAHKCANSWYWR